MADSKLIVPLIDPKSYLSEAVPGLERLIQHAYGDGYRSGYAQAKGDAIARVIEALRPAEDAKDADEADDAKVPGADTHKLVETVLLWSKSKGATPMEIHTSPANKQGISRQAIGKVLRRGEENGLYVNDGSGRYTLGKTGAANS
jgi:hypothetical protein